MKLSYNKILYISIIIGIVSSFFKQNFFETDLPNIYSLNNFFYYFSYIFILISTFSLALTNDKWYKNHILKNVYFILILVFFSWLYGILLGFKEGNNPILILRNYMFLSLSLPAYLIFSKISIKGIIEFSLRLPFLIYPFSFIQIPFAIIGLPSLLSIFNVFFNNEFNRNLFAYTYFYSSFMFFSCLFFSIAFAFERNSFQKILEKFNILNSRLTLTFYGFFKKYTLLSIFWFIWVTILAYFGNASILYLVFSLLLYSFAKLKRYRIKFISLFFFLLIVIAPYIYKYFINYFGYKRLIQIPIIFEKISILGNGLGSEIANKGMSYGTEIIILGVIVQLGIFAIPFLLLIFIYLRNLFILAWKSDGLSLLLALSYGGYLSTLFSNPTISYPWTYLFTLNGVLISEILKTKDINQILEDKNDLFLINNG